MIIRTVNRLSVTPVKSTALYRPDEIDLTRHGVLENRCFKFVDEHDRPLTAREAASLLTLRADPSPSEDHLAIRFPDGSVAEGHVAPSAKLRTNLWGRRFEAHVVEGPWSDAVSTYLGCSVRLVLSDQPEGVSDSYPASLFSSGSLGKVVQW